MPGDDRARTLSPDRERCALQVPQPLEQGVVGGAVVDGQVQGDGRNLEAGHEALAVGLEDRGVFQGAVGTGAGTGGDMVVGLQDGSGQERLVVGVRLGDLGLGIGPDVVDLGGVVGRHLRLVVLGDPGRRGRIGQEPHSDDRGDGADQSGDRQAPGAGAAMLLGARGTPARRPGGTGLTCGPRDHRAYALPGSLSGDRTGRARTARCRCSTNRGSSSTCTAAR